MAKHAYVTSCSGWFSERSASYLASGRPVVTEDSGHWHIRNKRIYALTTYTFSVAEKCRLARQGFGLGKSAGNARCVIVN